MITYPQLIDKIKKEINERIERSRRRKQIQGENTILDLNVYASKDRKKSSIKCLKDKLRYIQGQEHKILTICDEIPLTYFINYILFNFTHHFVDKFFPP